MNKPWTAAEEDLLSELWGTVSIPTIAVRLGRSETGIIERARRLELGPFLMAGDYVSLNQLMIALGRDNVDTYQITSWIKNRNMPVHKKKDINAVSAWSILMSFGNGQKKTETL